MSFGYQCPSCEGSYFRCAVIHDFCVRCVSCSHCKKSTCKCLECDISGHLQSSCSGGSQCWEPEVYCIVAKGYVTDLGENFYGTYNGFGYVSPHKISKYKYINESLYENEENTIPIQIMCKSCYERMLLYYQNLEKEFEIMKNDINTMDDDERQEYELFKTGQNNNYIYNLNSF
jgi:hypothetical protein